MNCLNSFTNSRYRKTNKKTRSLVAARLADGFTFEDFQKVIAHKTGEWLGTDHDKYLRPETLFGSKFEGYVQAARRSKVTAPAEISVDGFQVKLEAGAQMEGGFKRLLQKVKDPDRWIKQRQQDGLVKVFPKLYEQVWQQIGVGV